MNVVRLL